MNRICVFALMGGLFATIASADDAKLVAHGGQVYTASKCSVCHSIADKGNKKGPLDSVGSKLSDGEIRQWIVAAPEMAAKAKAERKPPMKAMPKMAKHDLEALVAYLQTLKKE